MADDKQNRGAQDRNRINMNEDYEVAYWTKELGVSREQLAEAVKKVGVSADAVRAEISRQRRKKPRQRELGWRDSLRGILERCSFAIGGCERRASGLFIERAPRHPATM